MGDSVAGEPVNEHDDIGGGGQHHVCDDLVLPAGGCDEAGDAQTPQVAAQFFDMAWGHAQPEQHITTRPQRVRVHVRLKVEYAGFHEFAPVPGDRGGVDM